MGSLTVCQFLSESCSDMNDALKHVGIVKHSAAQTRSRYWYYFIIVNI